MRATRSLDGVRADALLVPMAAGAKLPEAARVLPPALIAALEDALEGEFKARLGEVVALHTLGLAQVRTVALVGLGPAGKLDRARLGNAFQLGLRSLRATVRRLALLADGRVGDFDAGDLAEAR